MHPEHAAWAWRVRLVSTGRTPSSVDVLHGPGPGPGRRGRRPQQRGLHLAVHRPSSRRGRAGWAGSSLRARTRRRPAGAIPGSPWHAPAGRRRTARTPCSSLERTTAWPGCPAAVRGRNLPSRRLQYECAMAGLQSRAVDLRPGAAAEFVFVARYLPDHPGASGEADLGRLREVLPADWARRRRGRRAGRALGAAGRAVALRRGALASRGPARGGGLGRVVSGGAAPRGARAGRGPPRVFPRGLDACRWARQGGHGGAAARAHPAKRRVALDRRRPIRHDVLRGRDLRLAGLSWQPDIRMPPPGGPGPAGPRPGGGPARLPPPGRWLAAAGRAVGLRHDARRTRAGYTASAPRSSRPGSGARPRARPPFWSCASGPADSRPSSSSPTLCRSTRTSSITPERSGCSTTTDGPRAGRIRPASSGAFSRGLLRHRLGGREAEGPRSAATSFCSRTGAPGASPA